MLRFGSPDLDLFAGYGTIDFIDCRLLYGFRKESLLGLGDQSKWIMEIVLWMITTVPVRRFHLLN